MLGLAVLLGLLLAGALLEHGAAADFQGEVAALLAAAGAGPVGGRLGREGLGVVAPILARVRRPSPNCKKAGEIKG